ncbi:MAG TPA: SAM-dependent methyltransferase [Candidatus Deferrimicrobium sp.]|nr:SAM-dependent methyltransferase [Candidatus Deferrimicrobium sp.]
MQAKYETTVINLMQALPFINAVVVIEGNADIVYSTASWDIKKDVASVISNWLSKNAESIIINDIIYTIRLCTSERLVATSMSGEGHIVGAKDQKRIIIAQLAQDGIIGFAYIEMARALILLSANKVYQEQKAIKIKETQLPSKKQQDFNNEKIAVPFTARLMAYYRALEYKRDSPLIVDPYAERLAGDMTSYLKEHIRYSEMDYPIVRSYYIEENLLTPWCNKHPRSQIVLLGSGLDSRAYRFTPLQINTHTIFEVDFPSIIRYKEELLHSEEPLCGLIRLSADLSNPDWMPQLKKSGFSSNIPTFWVLEGLVYYMDREVVASLLAKAAEISAKSSQIFVDILQYSRWLSDSSSLNGIMAGPFSTHFKWGLDIKDVPSFFSSAGWKVSCSFADLHDQGRDVGQKGMIFIYGVRAYLGD